MIHHFLEKGRRLSRPVVLFLSFVLFLLIRADARHVVAETTQVVGDIPIVESTHPYANNTDKTWLIYNDTGSPAASVHFNRIELENFVDRIEILDEHDVVVQRIDTSSSGIESAPVVGPVIKVRLLTDASDSAWGFQIDSINAKDYPSLGYSPHPYPNNSDDVVWIYNDEANAPGTRIVFEHIFLEENVDYIILENADGEPFQWITGTHITGLTSKAIPGTAVRVHLVSDNSVNAWGYHISDVQTAPPGTADSPPDYGEALAESSHPHPTTCSTTDPNFTYIVQNPDPTAVNSKIHFEKIDMGAGDSISIYDSDDRLIQKFGGLHENVWSDYVPGRIIKVVMKCSDFYVGWGFLVDAIATAGFDKVLAQSDHYYGEGTWNWGIVNEADPNAIASKLHFESIQLNAGDSIRIYDVNNTLIQIFGSNTHLTDVWTDYVPGRFIRVELHSTDFYNDWGFRVDRIASSKEGPVWAQSNHPYSAGDPEPIIIVNPYVNAQTTRIHFDRITINSGDRLDILDENDTVIQSFGRYTDVRDFWSDPVPGNLVKLDFRATDIYNDWGFRVDDISPDSPDPIPAAFVSGVYVSVLYPGTIFLNGHEVAKVSQPGEYKVNLSGIGTHRIRLDYPQHTQDILITFAANQGVNIVYLPLVKK